MKSPQFGYRLPWRQSGVGIVELLVATAIGSVLLVGAGQLYLASDRAYRYQESLSRLQENGRMALQLLSRELRMVGYDTSNCDDGYGGEPENTLDVPDDELEEHYSPPQSSENIQGHEYVDEQWDADLHEEIASEAATDSDVLTVAETKENANSVEVTKQPGSGGNGNSGGGNSGGGNAAALHVNDSSQFSPGEIVMVTNCESSAVFQITNVRPNSQVVVHNTGGKESPGNKKKNLGADFTGGFFVPPQMSAGYYVHQAEDRDVPSLYRIVRDEDLDPVEWITGVERMALQFGVDSNGDRQIDAYKAAPDVGDAWSEVVAVRISLLMVSRDNGVIDGPQELHFDGEEINPDDGRLRLVFTSTTSLRNRLR